VRVKKGSMTTLQCGKELNGPYHMD